MVNYGLLAQTLWQDAPLLQLSLLLAESATKPPILQMSSENRFRALALVALLLVLGLVLIALTWLGARFTRRYMNRDSRATVLEDSRPRQDDWTDLPLDHEPRIKD